MMSSKRTSKIAVLSILLTFTHSIGLANTNPPVGLTTVCVEPKAVHSHQKRSEESGTQEVSRSSHSKWCFRPFARALSARTHRARKSSSQVAFGPKYENMSRARKIKLLKERSLKEIGRKESSAPSNLNLNELSPKLPPRQKVYIHEKEKAGSIFVRESRLSSGRKRYCTPSSGSPSIFLETEIVQAPAEKATERQDDRIYVPVVQMQAHYQQEDAKKTRQLASQALGKRSEGTDESLRELAQGASLPILVRPKPEVSVQRQKEILLKELVAERKQCRRKSSREALESRYITKQVPRGGSITSTLRYDPEKAAEIKSRRNCKVSLEAREQKCSSCKRDARANGKQGNIAPTEDASKEEKQAVVGPAGKTPQARSQVANNSRNFYRNAANTNIDTYLAANQYSCNSEETDWPCSSCVSKRRTHNSISVCTMVVTVIAMIVGALIIANATESQKTPDPAPTPTP
ncbi:hypothetical protein [Candidatus Chlamydia corallus]|uniref:hypothetical protein n=1 Tax=Candidatus Chlamydia corallus TaxID=2038470 RepID=UPI000C2FEEE9|nr:hypothetical protein [Candidatus Chlamydia corallus]